MPPRRRPPPAAAAPDRLTAWLAAVGAALSPSVRVAPDTHAGGGGVRVVATGALDAGAWLATLPSACLLSPATSGLGGALAEARIGGGLALVIAVTAELAAGDASAWAGYLSTLPPGGEPLPCRWSPPARAWLAGTDADGGGADDAAALASDFEETALPFAVAHAAALPGGGASLARFTHAAFVTAATYVSSRSFGVGGGHGTALVPFADAFNHKHSVVAVASRGGAGGGRLVVDGACMESDSDSDSDSEEGGAAADSADAAADSADAAAASDDADPGPPIARPRADGLALQLVLVADESGGLRLYTASPVRGGDEIFNTYGELPNGALLLKYGFCQATPPNPFNSVRLAPSLLLTAAAAALGARATRARARLLSRDTDLLDAACDHLEVSGGGADWSAGPAVSGGLRVALRVLFACDDDFDAWHSAADAAGPGRVGAAPLATCAALNPPLTPAGAAGLAAALRARRDALVAAAPAASPDADAALAPADRPHVEAAVRLRRAEETLLTACIEAAERMG